MRKIHKFLMSGAGIATTLILGVAETFSIPAGIYVAYQTGSIFHGLASFFVPLYGIFYTAAHYLF